jgi:hypothetical protein
VAQISQELGIHQATLYNWRKSWRLQGEVVWINPTADDFIAQTAKLALAA